MDEAEKSRSEGKTCNPRMGFSILSYSYLCCIFSGIKIEAYMQSHRKKQRII